MKYIGSNWALHEGDAAKALHLIPNSSVDLVVTSPPYGSMREYKGYTIDFRKIAIQLYRVLKLGGVIVWIVSDQVVYGSESGASFRQAQFFMSMGLRLHDTMIWSKPGFNFPESVRYPQSWEYMFVFSRGRPKSFNSIKDRSNKWAGTRIHGTDRQKCGTLTPKSNDSIIPEYGPRFNLWEMPPNKEALGHPAAFPVQLAADHIQSWSAPGDTVLDPFTGSGSTGVAALDLQRRFVGVEIAKEYCHIAVKRLGGVSPDQTLTVQIQGNLSHG